MGFKKLLTRVVYLFLMTGVGFAHVSVAVAAEQSLSEAVKVGDGDTVQSLLENGVAVDSREPDGTTALHWAAHHDHEEIARLLLVSGASVDAVNRYEVTPLALAALNGSAGMIERLLDAGADPNRPNPEGETPLMTAARTGNRLALTVLLEHGADVDAIEAWRVASCGC